jgi:CDP-diglyceride synthetase
MNAIKEFLKKESLSFYSGLASVLLLLIGMIILLVNTHNAYYHDPNVILPLLSALALVLIIALLVVSQFVKSNHLGLVWIAIGILAMIAFMYMVGRRVESMAYILGSDLEKDNPLSMPALVQYFVGAAFYLLGIIAIAVSSFHEIVKK